MLCVYLTCLCFVFVLGLIARLTGFRLWQFLRYIKEEILIVLGTSSSEAALPRMITKLENVGCGKSVVGWSSPDLLFVQPRRHLDLPDDGGDLHRAGHNRPRLSEQPASCRAPVDFEGRQAVTWAAA